MLPLSIFEFMLDSLSRVGCKGPYREFTVEVNPEDVVQKGHAYVEGLLQLGVNRVSMGVQSFDDTILKWMNRRHDSARAMQAYSILEDCGVENISIDLIFGLPQLSSDDWERELDKALGISRTGRPPKHISSYQLSVEEGSALASLAAKGVWREASDEVCARQYEMLCHHLRDAGYNHYEISNFAQSGFEAVHNSAYWNHVPYIGLGPGAHSYASGAAQYVRKWNNPDLGAYLQAGRNGDFASVQGGEVLTEEQFDLERFMLGLRTSKGLSPEELLKVCSEEFLRKSTARGWLQLSDDGNFRIPEEYFFISDAIIAELS